MYIPVPNRFFSLAHDIRFHVNEIRSFLWEIILQAIWGALPTKEGKLDEQLSSQVEKKIFFANVRLTSFLRYAGIPLKLSTSFFAIAFLTAIPFVTIVEFAPRELANILTPILLFLIGLFALFSLTSLIWGDFVFFLYSVALARFGFDRIRTTFLVSDSESNGTYTCTLTSSNEEISVQKTNLDAFFRIGVYSIVLILLLLIWISSRFLIKYVKGSELTSVIQKVVNTAIFSKVATGLETINEFLQVNLFQLFQPDTLQPLAVVLTGVLIFSIFLNANRIAQSAIRSQHELSDREQITAGSEINRCGAIAQIVFYHLLVGSLEGEFEEIRSQIASATFITFLTLCLSGFFFYVFINW